MKKIISTILLVLLCSFGNTAFADEISETDIAEMKEYYIGAMEEIETKGYDLSEIQSDDIVEELKANTRVNSRGGVNFNQTYLKGEITVLITDNSYSVYFNKDGTVTSIDNFSGNRIVNTYENDDIMDVRSNGTIKESINLVISSVILITVVIGIIIGVKRKKKKLKK